MWSPRNCTGDEFAAPSPEQLDASEYIDPKARAAPYAAGNTYRFASITLEKVVNTNDAPADIGFTLEGAPPGFLIDPTDGYVQGLSLTAGVFNVSLVAVDSQNSKAIIESFEVVIKNKDTDNAAFGPGGRDCEFGKRYDATPFDQEFACNCTGTSYSGANCDVGLNLAGPKAGANVGRVFGGITLVVVVSWNVLKR
jgi:hypothetical protein